MRIDTVKLKKLLLKVLPYLLFGLFCTHFGRHGAWRKGTNTSERLLSFSRRQVLRSAIPFRAFTLSIC